jgi:hypothetical protein
MVKGACTQSTKSLNTVFQILVLCAGLPEVLVRATGPLFGRRTRELQRRLLQGRPQGEFHPHSVKGQ